MNINDEDDDDDGKEPLSISWILMYIALAIIVLLICFE